MITVRHAVAADDIAFGVIRLERVSVGDAGLPLVEALTELVHRRQHQELTSDEEHLRLASRDMLRKGRYKPTGRGKPASEYLLRQSQRGDFPAINGLVDANNLISLKYLVPISVWDLELANTAQFEFRLGAAEETYVFNQAQQTLALQDLVCGCGLLSAGNSQAMVTPIKDGAATKLRADSRTIAAAIYYPIAAGDRAQLEEITRSLLGWLSQASEEEGSMALLLPGEVVEL